MPVLDPQVAMHRLNINLDVKPVKQQQQRFHREMMKVIQSEVTNLWTPILSGKNNTQIGQLISSPSPRKIERFEFALISVI